MAYFLTFLEGLLAFISPCFLPLFPIFLAFLSGEEKDGRRPLHRTLFFCLGFSLVFIALGIIFGGIGSFVYRFEPVLNIVTGVAVILFGLYFLSVLDLPFLNRPGGNLKEIPINSAFAAFLFGAIFSISSGPCQGAFLGSALMQAASSASMITGALMLFCYSLGHAILFILSAVLYEKIKGVFAAVNRHQAVISKISGAFLVIIGILMITGKFNYIFAIF